MARPLTLFDSVKAEREEKDIEGMLKVSEIAQEL